MSEHGEYWAGSLPSPGSGGHRPPYRPWRRGRRHLLAALVVFIMAALFMMFGLAVFTLVFLVDGWFETGAVLAGVASGLGVAAVVSLATLVLGMVLDRLTSTAPTAVRLAAPAPLAVVGIVLLSVSSNGVIFYIGFYLMGLTVALCVHWAVFLLQEAVGRSARRVLGRRSRTTRRMVRPVDLHSSGSDFPPLPRNR